MADFDARYRDLEERIGKAISSADSAQDRIERQQFARKYREMHRWVRKPDGSESLHVGAENWPFPFPLVAVEGGWRFDAEAGMKEVLLRRIGKDEMAAIAACRALVTEKQPAVSSLPKPFGSVRRRTRIRPHDDE